MTALKQIELNLLKKNRVYFQCETTNGYKVKLRITPESAELALGKHALVVTDESVHTKYGTDVIYAVQSEIKKEEGIVTLSHRYNKNLVEKCKNLAGRWDADSKVWVFPKSVEGEVEELDYIYNIDLVTIDITALQDNYAAKGPLTIAGYVIAEARGRDTGAKLADGVIMLKGEIYSSGSVKNWATETKEGSKFRIVLSRNILQLINTEKWSYEIIN